MKIMYSIAPEEGAWLRFIISVKPDGTFTTEFDYDGYDANRDPNMLVAAFVEYPRSRMYTPTWWEDILPYKTKYLVSKREKAAMFKIDLSETGLTINGEKVEEGLSSNLLVRAFGEEHLDTGFKLRTDKNGYKNRYAQKTYLKWEEAGIMAVRDEDDNSMCSAVYLQIMERNSADTFYPSLSDNFIGQFTIDGKAVELKKGMHLRKGKYEINVTDDGTGLLEIVCHNVRCMSASWREYRKRTEENMQLMFEAQTELRDTERAANYNRECINEKDKLILLNKLSRKYLDYALESMRNGYAQGRSFSFIGGTFLSPVVEGITKCMSYGNISFNEILFVIASCLLFKYDKGDLRKFAEILSSNGIADSVFDRMICRRIPEWTISDCTEFKAIDLWMERNNTPEYTNLQSSIKLYFCSEVDCKIIFDAITSK